MQLAIRSVVGLLAGVSLGLTTLAGAHATPYGNSVDSSTNPPEIRYTTSSKYAFAVNNAIDKWNALPGGVSILPDAWNTYNDLEIYDTYTSDSWSGYFTWHPGGADNMRFNTRVLDQSTWGACHDSKVALHEFGHSLDFDHNYYAFSYSIMRQGKHCTYNLPQHERDDFDARWN